MQAIKPLLDSLTARLAQVAGVEAVVLGGSWARGAASANSDIDLGLYYHPDKPLDIAALRQIAAQVDDSGSGEAVTDIGGWGPWINGGAWLTIGGQRVDFIYRDIAKVSGIIADCRAGEIACYYQPGHPHGFHTHIYMAEVYYGKPLYDPNAKYAAMQALTIPYPDAMQQAITRLYGWESGFALETAHKSAMRGEAFYVAGCLFRAAACMVQTLFALNRQYMTNEKGAVALTPNFALCPADFADTVQRVLAHPGETPAQLEASIAAFAHLVQQIDALVKSQV